MPDHKPILIHREPGDAFIEIEQGFLYAAIRCSEIISVETVCDPEQEFHGLDIAIGSDDACSLETNTADEARFAAKAILTALK